MKREVDVTVLGGGIAGLWALAVLLRAGYRAVLLESGALGGVQTIASQGIIHGGTKYALGGILTDSARAIGDMPRVWRDCLAGRGDVDLARVKVLSECQHLWSTGHVVSRLAGFFAGELMSSRMERLPARDRPAFVADPGFRGDVYRLEEPVLDVSSLVAELARLAGDRCYRVERDTLHLDPDRPGRLLVDTAEGRCQIDAARLVLCAGAGNAGLLQALRRDAPAMQRRPLHMVMARGPLPTAFAHCLGPSASPRLTISSHDGGEGERVWYLGGRIAETGVERDVEAQIEAARDELRAVLPWLDFRAVAFSTVRIDRAERATADGRRPEQAFVSSEAGVVTVWPTKLAFAPRAAQWVLAALHAEAVAPGEGAVEPLPLPRPPLAILPWDEVSRWS